MTNEKITLRIPRKFWDNHSLRFWAEEEECGKEVSSNKVWAVVEFTDESLHLLIDDADYYASPDMRRWFREDEAPDMIALSEAAERLLQSIFRQWQPAWGVDDTVISRWVA